MGHLMNTKDRLSNLRESIRDKQKDEHGMTIVEVMVAFVLVLLAIAMITTATTMATKIQKKTQENQNRTAYLAELAYQKLQPNYDETEKRWKISIPSSELSNISAATKLHFTGNGTSFDVDVKTADWTVEADLESGEKIRTEYNIYQYQPKSEAGHPVVPGEQHRSPLDAYVLENSLRKEGDSYYLDFHVPPLSDAGQDCDQWRLHMPASVNAAEIVIPDSEKDLYWVQYEGNDIIIKMRGRGWFPDEKVFGIKFKLDLELTAEQMKELEHTKYVETAPSYEYASSSNTTIKTCYYKNDKSPYEAEISYTIAAGAKRLREYLEVDFGKEMEITSASGPDERYVKLQFEGNVLYVYGRTLETGESNNVTLTVKLQDADENNSSVKPSKPIIRFRE